MTERGQAPDDLRRFCEFGGMAGPVSKIRKDKSMTKYFIGAAVALAAFIVMTRYLPWKRLIDWLGRF